MATKPDYGIDAPGVIRNLFLCGAAFVVVTLVFPRVHIGGVEFALSPGLFWTAGGFFAGGGLMLLYGLVGKFRHRDRMLAEVSWTGGETVLDVGAGRGLLLIGAAKRLTTGHATGIDIWNAEDLSGNGPEALAANIAREGVGERTSIRSEDARSMSFADASFDVVLSNLCLHNIYRQPGRAKACREIARVLRPGAVAVLSDYKHVSEYAAELARCGLAVRLCPRDWTGTFPPLRILVARKPA
ncbi:MAG TPA: class I SAM-dependent methyltransferase [Steroidobacteraceae bacterium]|nr:class I SAM-dependent methyltransferase [Steroidobacteraceae bacterium]